MLKTDNHEVILTKNESQKLNYIKEYEYNFNCELNLIENNIKKEVENQYQLLMQTNDLKSCKNNLSQLGKSKYFTLFDINHDYFLSTVKPLKKYYKDNIILLFPLLALTASIASSGYFMLSAAIAIISAGFFSLFSFMEYKHKNKKYLKYIRKYIESEYENEQFQRNLLRHMEEQNVSLNNMVLLKAILDENTMKSIIYKSEGNATYEDFKYHVASIKKEIENKILKSNVDEIYSNI